MRSPSQEARPLQSQQVYQKGRVWAGGLEGSQVLSPLTAALSLRRPACRGEAPASWREGAFPRGVVRPPQKWAHLVDKQHWSR